MLLSVLGVIGIILGIFLLLIAAACVLLYKVVANFFKKLTMTHNENFNNRNDNPWRK